MTFWKSNIYNSQPLAFGHPKMFSELWGLNRVHLSPASKWRTCVDSDPDTKKCGWTGPRWTPMKMLVFSVPHLCWDPGFLWDWWKHVRSDPISWLPTVANKSYLGTSVLPELLKSYYKSSQFLNTTFRIQPPSFRIQPWPCYHTFISSRLLTLICLLLHDPHF